MLRHAVIAIVLFLGHCRADLFYRAASRTATSTVAAYGC